MPHYSKTKTTRLRTEWCFTTTILNQTTIIFTIIITTTTIIINYLNY